MRELSTQEMQQPKKPSNAFFLYRKDMKEYITTTFNISKSHEIVKQAAIMWKSESEQVKEKYKQMSNDEFKEHKRLYPDYVWPSGANSIKRVGKQRRLSSPASVINLSPSSSVATLTPTLGHRKSISAGSSFVHRNSNSSNLTYNPYQRSSQGHRSSISFSSPSGHRRSSSGPTLSAAFQPQPLFFPRQNDPFFNMQLPVAADIKIENLTNAYDPWSTKP